MYKLSTFIFTLFFFVIFAKALAQEKHAKQTINVKQFGVKGDGVTDETLNLKKCINFCIKNKTTILFETGKYVVSGNLANESETNEGELHIKCEGKVELIVDKNKLFKGSSLISLYHNNITNSTITGGSLIIDLNNTCPVGICIYAFGTKSGQKFQDFGGKLVWKTPITIKNAFAGVNTNGTAAGIQISGVFKHIFIQSPTIENVSRSTEFANAKKSFESIDECKGISITNLKGYVLINNPIVINISTPNDRDADGIAVFGFRENYNINDEAYKSLGTCKINNAKILDAQGRGMKFQCSNVIVKSPYFFRKNLISITQGHDIDFQWGNGQVFNSVHEYQLNNGVSPIKSENSFASIVFQNKLKDCNMKSFVGNATLKTDVKIAQFIYVVTGKKSKSWKLDLSGFQLKAPFKKNVLHRAFIEFSANEVNGITSMETGSIASISLKDINLYNTKYVVGYTGFNKSMETAKVFINLQKIKIKYPQSSKMIYNLSGNEIMLGKNFKVNYKL